MPGRTYSDRVLNISQVHHRTGSTHVDMLLDDHATASPHVQGFPAVYPAPSIPPPLHVHHFHAPPFRANHVLVPSSGPLHVHPGLHPTLSNPLWPHHVRIHPVLPMPPPPPPPILHKVWMLDCKSCGTFFTNRGMKAVLLLRPNVPLYSTDALPINCSAYSATQEASSSGPSSPTSPSPTRLAPITSDNTSSPSRTCECLTQTLCCHGCGTAVGYMIVIPCQRCTSSITASNRATNGHRFVFYSSEVAASERHYIPGERGVLPRGVPQQLRPPQLSPSYHSLFMARYAPVTPPRPHVDYLPTSPAEGEYPFPSIDSSPDTPSMPSLLTPRSAASASPPPNDTAGSPSQRPPQAPPPSASVSPPPVSQPQPQPQPESLHVGDVLFWHHLARRGEIPAVVEDARARDPPGVDFAEKGADDTRAEEPGGGCGEELPHRMLKGLVAGR